MSKQYKNQQAIGKPKVMGSYPYKWIKHFYSKGAGYGSEPHDFEGNSIVDETLVEVKGSELQQFLDEQLTKKSELQQFLDEQLTKKEEENKELRKIIRELLMKYNPQALALYKLEKYYTQTK
jgi:hypothetical protein